MIFDFLFKHYHLVLSRKNMSSDKELLKIINFQEILINHRCVINFRIAWVWTRDLRNPIRVYDCVLFRLISFVFGVCVWHIGTFKGLKCQLIYRIRLLRVIHEYIKRFYPESLRVLEVKRSSLLSFVDSGTWKMGPHKTHILWFMISCTWVVIWSH